MKKIALLLIVLLLAGASSVWAGTVERMDKDELKAMLGSADLILLDVRKGRDWSSSEFKIKGARRLVGDDVAAALQEYSKDKTIVLYCA